MKIRLHWQTAALVSALALALPSLRAAPQDQIVLIHDSQGRAVFVNAPEGSRPVSDSMDFTSTAPAPVHKLIRETSHSLEVDPRLVEAVVQVESGYNARARSPKGALGLMQLMPATAARFGVSNPFDPAENIRGGVTYLGHLLKQFNGDVPLSLAAYNAGEGAVLRQGGIPRFAETENYLRKVAALYPASSGSHVGGALPHLTALKQAHAPQLTADNAASPFPIYRYMDSQGVIHFSQ